MTDFAFLHGGGQGGWVWEQTIAALAAQSGGATRCLALDAPGCGAKRERDTAGIAFAKITRELIADVEAAGLRDIVLVGHSQAGMTMPQMAEFAPHLFRKLIYVTCSAPLPGVTTLAQMGEGRHGENVDEVGYPVGAEAEMTERFRAMFCNDMARAEADAFLAGLGADMWPMVCYSFDEWRYDHLRDIPSSYVLCLQDRALPPEWQHRFAERLHARRIHRVDAGHQVMNTRPQALAEILLMDGRD